ncbi:caspase family protein [Puniceicoccaceae bacterium K14]|nr:caspase family protein [Puniceicoccaceae bacterium K14]
MSRIFFTILTIVLLSTTACIHAQFEELLENPDLIEQSQFAPPAEESTVPASPQILPPEPPRLLSSSLHRDPIVQLDASPDGRYLLSADKHVLKIWDIEHRANIATFEQPTNGWRFNHPQVIMGAWFTNIPRQIVVCTNHQVYLYDNFDFAQSTLPRTTLEPTDFHFSESEQAIYASVFNKNLLKVFNSRIDLTTGKSKELPTLDLASEHLVKSGNLITPASREFLTVDPQGALATLRFQGKNPLFIIDLSSGQITARVPSSLGARGFLPDGRLLAHTYDQTSNTYSIVNPATYTASPILTFAAKASLPPKLPQRNGQALLLTSASNFALHDLVSGQTTPVQNFQNRVSDFAITLFNKQRPSHFIAQSKRKTQSYAEAETTHLEAISMPQGVFGAPWSEETFAPDVLAARHDDFELALSRGNKARQIRFTEIGLEITPLDIPTNELGKYKPVFNKQSSDWELLGSTQPRLANRQSPKSIYKTQALGPMERNLYRTFFHDISHDGRLIALHHNAAVTVFDRDSNKRIANFPIDSPYSFCNDNQQLLALSPDGQSVAFAYTTSTQKGWLDVIECYDVPTHKLLWRTQCDKTIETVDFLRFSYDGRLLYLKGPIGGPTGSNWFSSRFASTGEVNAKYDYSSAHLQAYNRSTSLVAQSIGQKLTVKTLPEGQVTASFSLNFKPSSLAFIGSDNFLVANAETDEIIRLIDIREHSVVAEVKLFEHPKKWLVRHPSTGLFNSETSLQKNLKFIQGETITPLESYFDEFYRPRLLGSLVKGLAPQPSISIEDLRQAPKLALTIDGPATRGLTVEDEFETFELPIPEVTLQLNATSEGSRISDLRIYHNGKLVSGGNTRGLFIEDDENAPSSDTFSKTHSQTFNLTPGKNRFRAVAINEQGTESAPDEIIVYSDSTAPDSEGGIALHLLVVGINTYQNPAYNLNYARIDAEAVQAALTQSTSKVFTQTNTYSLYDTDAKRANILATLDIIKSEATSRDVFIFYYAGHGVMSDEADPQFYLAPYEITQLYGKDRTLRQLGVSSDLLLKYSRDIAAQKQLFILDACQSAGALKTIAQRGAVEERAIAQLARSSGTHWLTATGSEQFATEFAELGHGAFTYTLLEALNGQADSGDNLVTVNELKAYLESQVPEVTLKAKGEAQYPVTYGYGQDFPIVVP